MDSITLHIDCDGILINFTQGVLDTFKEMTGIVVPYEKIDNWHVFETIARLHPEIPLVKERLHQYVAQKDWCRRLQPYPGASAALSWLREAGVDLHVVTSPWERSRYWHAERDESLWHYFGIEQKDVSHTYRKHDVGHHPDVFVDDKPAHVRAVLARGRVSSAYLWDSGPNRLEALELQRLKSWQALCEVLRPEHYRRSPPSAVLLARL